MADICMHFLPLHMKIYTNSALQSLFINRIAPSKGGPCVPRRRVYSPPIPTFAWSSLPAQLGSILPDRMDWLLGDAVR